MSENSHPDNVTELPTAAALQPHQKACVDLLRSALDQALKGQVNSIAIVLCTPTGVASAVAGPHAADLYVGMDFAKSRLMQAIFPPSNIIRPGGR